MAQKIDESDIELFIAGQRVGYNESYSIKMDIFTQPSQFSTSFGWGRTAADLLENVRPYQSFLLKIGGKPAFRGRLDKVSAAEGTGTTITMSGRDNIAELFRYKTDTDFQLSKTTYSGMLRELLERLEISPITIVENAELAAKQRTGAPQKRFSFAMDPGTSEFVIKESLSTINSQIKAQVGQTLYAFLKTYLDRASLFLWSGPNGEFILSRPNPNQKPIYKIFRSVDVNRSNAKLVEYSNDITDQHAFVAVNGRTGGTKAGRVYVKGAETNDYVLSLGLKNFRSVRDKHAHSPKQIDDLGKRIVAEERRKGFKLVYQVAGHRTERLGGGEAVWSIDTVVDVDDNLIGLKGSFFVEGVSYERSIGNGTTTTLSLMPLDALKF